MEELRNYVCDCGASQETEMWEAPVYNGFIKTDELYRFWPESIKCACGKRMYEEGTNPMGDGKAVLKYNHGGQPNVYEQIKNRPRGI